MLIELDAFGRPSGVNITNCLIALPLFFSISAGVYVCPYLSPPAGAGMYPARPSYPLTIWLRKLRVRSRLPGMPVAATSSSARGRMLSQWKVRTSWQQTSKSNPYMTRIGNAWWVDSRFLPQALECRRKHPHMPFRCGRARRGHHKSAQVCRGWSRNDLPRGPYL